MNHEHENAQEEYDETYMLSMLAGFGYCALCDASQMERFVRKGWVEQEVSDGSSGGRVTDKGHLALYNMARRWRRGP